MKWNKNLLLLFALIMAMISCKKENRWDCIKRTGSKTSEWRTLDNFNEVIVKSAFKIKLIGDGSEKIEIYGGKNLLPQIKTFVDGKSLCLENKNRCNWARDLNNEITINIHYKNLSQVFIYSTCSLTSADTIKTHSFKIEIIEGTAEINIPFKGEQLIFRQQSGTGNYCFSGTADSCNFYNKGTGYVYADGLESNIAHVYNKSTGDCFINAKKRLTIEYTGSGDTYYKGNPETIIFDEENSSGHVFSLQ